MQEKLTLQIVQEDIVLKRHQLISSIVGYIKLGLLVITFIFLFLLLDSDNKSPYYFMCSAFLILYILLSIFHSFKHMQIKNCQENITIRKRHLERINGNWISFEDNGSELLKADHPYDKDLDIVGPNSLFQLLNTTHTYYGRLNFVNDLLHSNYSIEEINSRQNSIKELADNFDDLMEYEHAFMKIGLDQNAVEFVKELEDTTPFIRQKWLGWLIKLLPIFTIPFIVFLIFFWQQPFIIIAEILAVVMMGSWIGGISRNQRYIANLANTPYKLNAYIGVIELLITKDYQSLNLKSIQERIKSEQGIIKAIQELSRISNMANYGKNPLIGLVLNLLSAWDYRVSLRYQKWRNQYAQSIKNWFTTLGEFESLTTLAIFPAIFSSATLPKIGEDGVFAATKLGHPLIKSDTRVDNDFSLNKEIYIISGSNMSGKTTFLRTVGINIILARIGSYVLAEKLELGLFRVVTSMRIQDDLNAGISTFYGELKRIKGLMEMAKKDTRTFFLIDEIFRGTNSVDRLDGAKGVITNLRKPSVYGLITTHDLELCTLAKQSKMIKNKSFTEQYQDNKISFDYKIRDGIATTTNARFLMEMLEIL